MATHDFEQRLPRQGALELKQRMIVIHVERDDGAVFACLWADARRRMPVFFHEVLLSENSYAYPQAYQKEQRPFNPSRAPGAPWVGSHYSSTLNLRYATRSTYYLAHRANINRYLQPVDAEFDALRQATRTADPQFHGKLVQARRQSQMTQVGK